MIKRLISHLRYRKKDPYVSDPCGCIYVRLPIGDPAPFRLPMFYARRLVQRCTEHGFWVG
jgi:hypothetical protein